MAGGCAVRRPHTSSPELRGAVMVIRFRRHQFAVTSRALEAPAARLRAGNKLAYFAARTAGYATKLWRSKGDWGSKTNSLYVCKL